MEMLKKIASGICIGVVAIFLLLAIGIMVLLVIEIVKLIPTAIPTIPYMGLIGQIAAIAFAALVAAGTFLGFVIGLEWVMNRRPRSSRPNN